MSDDLPADTIVAATTGELRELARLRRWQDEAIVVLSQWDACYDLMVKRGRPGRLGDLRAGHVYNLLDAAYPAED